MENPSKNPTNIHVGKYIQFPSHPMDRYVMDVIFFPYISSTLKLTAKYVLNNPWIESQPGQVLGQQDLESYPRLQRPFVDRWGVGGGG